MFKLRPEQPGTKKRSRSFAFGAWDDPDRCRSRSRAGRNRKRSTAELSKNGPGHGKRRAFLVSRGRRKSSRPYAAVNGSVRENLVRLVFALKSSLPRCSQTILPPLPGVVDSLVRQALAPVGLRRAWRRMASTNTRNIEVFCGIPSGSEGLG